MWREISTGITTVCSEKCSHDSSHVTATTNCFHSALGQNMQRGWGKMERKCSLGERLRVYTAFNNIWILMALGTTGVQVLMTSVGTISKGKGQAVCKLCTTEKPDDLSLHPDPLISQKPCMFPWGKSEKVLYMTKDKIIHWALPLCFSVVLWLQGENKLNKCWALKPEDTLKAPIFQVCIVQGYCDHRWSDILRSESRCLAETEHSLAKETDEWDDLSRKSHGKAKKSWACSFYLEQNGKAEVSSCCLCTGNLWIFISCTFSFSLLAAGGVSTRFRSSAIDYRGSHGCSVIIELECVGVGFGVWNETGSER